LQSPDFASQQLVQLPRGFLLQLWNHRAVVDRLAQLTIAQELYHHPAPAPRWSAASPCVALLAATTADVARCQGDYARAEELYSESLALYQELGNWAELPALLHNQGYVALGTRDYAAARGSCLPRAFAASTLRVTWRVSPKG
jgi:hypothetical protein